MHNLNNGGMTPPPPMGGQPYGMPPQPMGGQQPYGVTPQPMGGQPVINLRKGEKISLTKVDATLTKLMLGLGWDTNRYTGGAEFDLDVSVFGVDANNLCQPQDFIFYGNLKGCNGSVTHMGDNRTGEGDGDDEQVFIDLNMVPQHIQKLVVVVTIYDAIPRSQNFGQVTNSYVRLMNANNVMNPAHVRDFNGQELLKFDLGENFSLETAVNVCEIYRYNGEWKFNAVGAGYAKGLDAFCREFGLQV